MPGFDDQQLLLPFGPIRNSELFSNYWLTHRLPLEPDWVELRPAAEDALRKLERLWADQKLHVQKYGNEAPLEEAFIQPVLRALGWHIYYQPQVQGRQPDYALFLDAESSARALDAGFRSPAFWSHAALVADAKAWHIPLDKPRRVSGAREYPPEQIEWYLERTQLNWGILTNGRLWRLIPRVVPLGKPRFQTFFEVDLSKLLESHSNDREMQIGIEGQHIQEFLLFYLVFSPVGFDDRLERRPLLQRALEGSTEYAVGVSEDLRDRVFDALRLAIEGLLKLPENDLASDRDLEECRTNSFILLYRLLFIMYAEDRGFLPYRRNRTYTRNRSLARFRDEVASQLDRRTPDSYAPDSVTLWDRLQDLFDLVDRGHAAYGVPAYNGGLFSREQHPFLTNKKLSDRYLAQIIDKLGRTRDPKRPQDGFFRVDYRDLAIRQLGSVYEGLLEMRPTDSRASPPDPTAEGGRIQWRDISPCWTACTS